MTPPRKSESFESIIAISCERRVQRLKRANNLERKRKRERRGEEWSGPGPVRNVIRPRKLQFPHGPGITARRHKIYPRVRALVGRGSLFNCLSFARIRTFYRGNCTQVFPRLLLLPSSPPLIRSSCTRIKTTFVSAGFETKVGNIGDLLSSLCNVSIRGLNGGEPRNFEIFANFFCFRDSRFLARLIIDGVGDLLLRF